MNRITSIFEWIEERLDKGCWFRRVYVFVATVLVWRTMIWAYGYAEANAARPGLEVAAVIGAVASIPAIVATFAFREYNTGRSA